MHKINIKALSVNQAFKGRKVKTDQYKAYEFILYNLLPETIEVPKGKLILVAEVGYSSSGSDIDNFLKPFIDVLQKAYNFNDNRIYKLDITKTIVQKGSEFVSFNLKKY